MCERMYLVIKSIINKGGVHEDYILKKGDIIKLGRAKFLSSKGYGSRREIEQLILKNKIIVNKEIISSPITFVNNDDEIVINNKKINLQKKLDVWKFYKPLNYITSRNKQDDRPIIYDLLPFNLKKIKTVGRLDINSEGLLLLTDDGEIIRNLELPKNKFIRKYKIRVYGYIDETSLDRISKGVKINNIQYAPFEYKLLKKGNATHSYLFGWRLFLVPFVSVAIEHDAQRQRRRYPR